MADGRVSDAFFTADWLKERDTYLEFELPFSEAVRDRIRRKCFEGQEVSYDFSVAAIGGTIRQVDGLKRYINSRYGIDTDGVSFEIPDGGDLERRKKRKECLEKLAMTLAQLEENATDRFRSPGFDERGVIVAFRAMIRSSYESRYAECGCSSLEGLKQLLHDIQLWEFNSGILSQRGGWYPVLSYHMSSNYTPSNDTQAEREHTIRQVQLITQSVAKRYGLDEFGSLSSKFSSGGVSRDLTEGRRDMKRIIEEIAFSLHSLEEKKVAAYKARNCAATAEQISEFRLGVCRELGAHCSGEEFRCPAGAYRNLQMVLRNILSGEDFESLLISAKREFAEGLASSMVREETQNVHIAPYMINIVAHVWGLKEKNRRDDESSGIYSRFIAGHRGFVDNFKAKLEEGRTSESFRRIISENLAGKIIAKATMDLPIFSRYEEPDYWISIIGTDSAAEVHRSAMDSQDDYVDEIASVLKNFCIDKYFSGPDVSLEDSIRGVLFKNDISDDATKVKIEVKRDNLMRFIQYACMYKMASYDPPLITGISKEVFLVPLRAYEEAVKSVSLTTCPYVSPSIVLGEFETSPQDMEFARYELVCFTLDNDIKIGAADSQCAPLDYLFELDAAAASRFLERYIDSYPGALDGRAPLSLLMKIAQHENARELLRLCRPFRDERDSMLDEVLRAVLLLRRMQDSFYVARELDFSPLWSLVSYHYTDEVKASLSHKLKGLFTEHLPDMKEIIEVIRNILVLEDLAPVLSRNKKVALAVVNQDWRALKYADVSLRKDKKVVLAVVRQSGLALEYADDSLKGDRDVILEAVRLDWHALKFADASLKGDKKVVLAAVGQDWRAVRFADASLKGDKKVVLAAVGQNWRAVRYANDFLKGDRDVILAAVRQDWRAVRFADDSLKGDRDVILEAVRLDWHALKFADASLKGDKKVVLAAVGQDWRALKFADASLKGDKGIVLAAVGQDWRALEYANDSLKRNKEVVLAAVMQSWCALEYADVSLRKDKSVVLAAVNQDWCALEYADASLRKDKSVILAAVTQDWRALDCADASLKGDRDIILAAVWQSRLAFRYADDSLRGNEEVVLAVVRQSGLALEYADDSLRGNKEVVLAAVRQSGLALEYADDSLRGNKEVVLAAVRQSGLALEYADASLKRDKEVVLAAVRQSGLALEYADASLRGDKEVVLAAVRQNGLALKFVDYSLEEDKEVVLEAARQNSEALSYAFLQQEDKEVAFIVLMKALCNICYISCTLNAWPSTILDNLRADIIATLPERYRRGAEVLLNTKAHISSEIPFVLQDESLSSVFEMKWTQRTHTPEDMLAYCDNLSKLLAMKVILQLCCGDIHSERFAQMCTKQNIDSLSESIRSGLDGLDIEVLMNICCGIERLVGVHVAPLASDGPAAAPPLMQPLTQFVHDRLAAAAHGEHGGVVIPHIEFSEGFFRSYIREHTQEHAPQEGQAL